MEVVYSRNRVPVSAGTVVLNPSFFVTTEAGATRVKLNGSFPRIAAAYGDIGVPVDPLYPPKPPKKRGD